MKRNWNFFRLQVLLKEMLESGDWFSADGLIEAILDRDWGPDRGKTTLTIPTRGEIRSAIRSAPVWLPFIGPFMVEKRKHQYWHDTMSRTTTYYRFCKLPDELLTQEEE